jgi:hypothetical protein
MTDHKRPGRPRLHPDDRPAAPVHLKLAADVYDAASKVAATRRESIQDVIRRGLERELRGSEIKRLV